MSNLEFWYHGLSWLGDGIHSWPTQNFPCLDRHSRCIAGSSANFLLVLLSSPCGFLRSPVYWRSHLCCSSSSVDCGDERKTVTGKQFFIEWKFCNKKNLQRSLDSSWIDLTGRCHRWSMFSGGDDPLRRSSHFAYDANNPFYWTKTLINKHIVMDCDSRC